MSALRLGIRRDAPVGIIDGSLFRPDDLCRRSTGEIERLALRAGRSDVPLAEVFDVREDAGMPADRLEVEGDVRIVRIGAGMRAGSLVVRGSCGDLAGAGMSGGELEVHGDAADLAGAGMSGGRLHVRGSAGDLLGGPLPAAERGMSGGEIVVHGKSGDFAGLRQRRGLIAVGDTAGRCAGFHMLAGTLVVAKGELSLAGLGMRRGTLIALEATPPPPPGFREDGPTQPVFVRLLWRRLAALGFPPALAADAPVELLAFSGDHLGLGRGEILYLAGP